ncbi:ATP-binding cassette domain-containing protein, partial [bacterium]|nr:ATP-binding cassette domain-containing protein [bacterium]
SKISSIFDIPINEKLKKTWNFNFPIEEKDWKIGLIIGASGSGKTTLAKHIFNEENYHHSFEWGDSAFVEYFDKNISIEKIIETLNKVGFSSPPSWVLPFEKLSNGQKFRTEIARILLSNRELTIIDEFTSVIDRNVARISCMAISKFIKKTENKKIVAVSCHYDVEEYLQPDWVFDVNTLEFKWGCLRRPEFKFTVYKCDKKAWKLFEGYHYLSSSLNNAAQCFVMFLDDLVPIAFSSYIHQQHPHVKNMKREHRTVVLPDYQGIGLGNMMSNFVAEYVTSIKCKYSSTTSHPALIFSRLKDKNWVLSKAPKILNRAQGKEKKSNSIGRVTATFLYKNNNNKKEVCNDTEKRPEG